MKTNLVLAAFIIGLVAFGFYVVIEYPEMHESNLLIQGQGNVLSDNSVILKADQFYPDIITVKVGQTVTWTNDDTDAHRIIFDKSVVEVTGVSDNIPLLASGDKFSLQFSKPGDFTYYSSGEPAIRGHVVVLE
jgi:plastocyanin